MIDYYGYTDYYGDDAKQAAWNQAIYLYGQVVIGNLYLNGGIYYSDEAYAYEAPNGTYLTVISYNWQTSTFIEVSGQTPPEPTTTTLSPTTTQSPTTTSSGTTTSGGTTTVSPTTTYSPTDYGLRLYFQFVNVHNQTCRIEIYEKLYSGTSEEMVMGLPAFTLTMDNADATLDSPILKTVATLPIKNTGTFNYDSFFTPDATKFKVLFKINGATEWSGYITPDSFERELAYHNEVVLKVRDNLGYLNDLPFDLAGRTSSIANIITTALNRISATFGITSRYNIQDSDNTNVLAGVVRLSKLREGTWGEALNELLKSIGAQLRFIGGNTFALFNIGNLKGYGTTPVYQTPIFINKSGLRRIQPAWRQIKYTQDYQYTEDITDTITDSNYGFSKNEVIDINTISLYTLDGFGSIGGGQGEGSLDIPKPTQWGYSFKDLLITGNNYTTNTSLKDSVLYSIAVPKLQNKMSITLRASTCAFNYKPAGSIVNGVTVTNSYLGSLGLGYQLKLRFNVFFVPDGTTDIYILGEDWEIYDNSVRYIEMVLPTAQSNFDYIDISINIQRIERRGTLQIHMYPYQITDEFWSSSLNDYYCVVYKDFKVSIEQSAIAEGDEFSLTYNPTHNIKHDNSFDYGTVPVEQGDSLTMLGGIFKQAAYNPPMVGIHRANEAGNYSMMQMVAREVLHHFKAQRNILSGTVICDQLPSFDKMFSYDNKTYALNYGSLDYQKGQMNIEVIEVDEYIDPITPTSTTTLAPTTTIAPTTVAPTTTVARNQVAYYGYSDFTGTQQDAYNSGSPLFDVMGYIYEFGGEYYANPTGEERPSDGYYLTVVGVDWENSTYVTIGTPPSPTTTVPPTTTTIAPTTTAAPTTTTAPTTIAPTTTSAEPTTTAPPTTTTTLAPTTTVLQRQEVQYYGYDDDNLSECFFSGLTGSIWYVDEFSLVYTTQFGDTTVPDGYYMTIQGSGVEDSEFLYILNGFIQ